MVNNYKFIDIRYSTTQPLKKSFRLLLGTNLFFFYFIIAIPHIHDVIKSMLIAIYTMRHDIGVALNCKVIETYRN